MKLPSLELIRDLLESKSYARLRSELIEENPVDLAEFLEDFTGGELLLLYRLLPKELAADTFSYMEPELQQKIVEGITDRELSRIIEELYTDDAADFLEEMPANIVKRVLASATADTRQQINQLLKYPEDSAGTLMTVEFMELRQHHTVRQAIASIRAQASEKESIASCYVTDSRRRLEGLVEIHTILAAGDDEIIGELMDDDVLSVTAYEDQAQVAELFKRYDLLSLPVVDKENRLVGLITVDDIVDVIEEEATEDFYKMAAVTPDDATYLRTTPLGLAKNRLTWLLVLMISSTISGTIIRGYEALLSSVVVLTSYIPALTNTGGNAGSQSATMIIRGLALGEVEFSDALRILWKELRVSLVVGLVLSVVNFGRILIFDQVSIPIAFTVCAALYATVILANLCGGLLPILAQKCRVDPAIMAAPLITTIVDAVSLTIFFSIATVILRIPVQ